MAQSTVLESLYLAKEEEILCEVNTSLDEWVNESFLWIPIAVMNCYKQLHACTCIKVKIKAIIKNNMT